MKLLRHVAYIQEGQVKIHSFLGGLPLSYEDRIEFYNPQILEVTIRMETHYYEKRKGKVKD